MKREYGLSSIFIILTTLISFDTSAATKEVKSLAEVLGYQFGSLSCIDIKDPAENYACQAGSISNGKGCMGLSATSMR
ncbi:hypothetical protein GCM10009425_44960 [Pseudomonas asuensis]|uniref:DUF2282 domain-containing protein n=1 Tax=Pseudomonas asuensis TaxID=1825787 RepID=A0ABQ2H462_9PSED|nr:hypothetical protein GCM10009425_44960 [Pseudomonas asuensis]